MPSEWREPWRDLLVSLSTRSLFILDRLPSGVVRTQLTAVFLFGSLRDLWSDVWAHLGDGETPMVLALPEDIRQPDRPDRLVRDTLIRPPRLTLPQWDETYSE